MLPPVLLDIQPGQTVVDMCAAPGSKTAQIIELLRGQGCVVANDVDTNRAFMLIQQLHSLPMPTLQPGIRASQFHRCDK
ncbi:MAG: hypothetical protein ACKOZY_07900 [Flavobacteriales bacterium]